HPILPFGVLRDLPQGEGVRSPEGFLRTEQGVYLGEGDCFAAPEERRDLRRAHSLLGKLYCAPTRTGGSQ
ncbi:MAG TPA: hypothetical protein VFQ13_07165, partial [Anaerolineales bacterium]|nr:hypothetical protein [Anaerolineales bacterium]